MAIESSCLQCFRRGLNQTQIKSSKHVDAVTALAGTSAKNLNCYEEPTIVVAVVSSRTKRVDDVVDVTSLSALDVVEIK